jgi:hypothetical protein
MTKYLYRIGFCALWLLTTAAGFLVLLNYESKGGSAGPTAGHWPANSQIKRVQNQNTLVMFAHPRCSCTRASLDELNRLLTSCSEKVTVQIWFFKPSQHSNEWTENGLWRSAAAIPNVTVHEDLDGAQATLFGAETSGYVLLYNNAGQLLFKGGITGSRGHVGDNPNEDTLVSLLNGQTSGLKQTSVYGCPLLDKYVIARKGIQ